MGDTPNIQRDLSPRRIIGFACYQAFVFFSLFFAVEVDASLYWLGFGCLPAFMVLGFAVMRALGPARFQALFARPLLYLYAIIAAGGALISLFDFIAEVPGLVVRGALIGVPSAFLLTAWGRSFGNEPSRVSVTEVFMGSLVAALVCLVFSLSGSSSVFVGAVCFLPIASVVNIDVSDDREEGKAPLNGAASEDASSNALSAKILAGTFLFGVAAGLMVLSWSSESAASPAHYRMSMVFFGAYLIGGLTLLLSDGFGRGAALNKSYRLAVFIMMTGVLVYPLSVFAASPMPGETIVMAGFLGLEAVLISLYLVLAEVMGTDCSLALSSGFLALFSGVTMGVLAAAGLYLALHGVLESYVLVVVSGIVTLIGYFFLFTERDFDALSQLVTENDSFEEVCARIVDRYGLSKRESEILAFALRGRTSERIAQELVISKSTVDTHLRRIYVKCGVHSRQELIDLME